ncbi:hypothetical protein P3T76_001086 [Phytophthora citrophthora]|uniref:Uncharacterized protein n=1 Tax=Phytophthora citrophthora TaxID=4793 RepID=A0AAD9LSK9_9STRA|nr:hypothetical protein P3T76_001086 [Phytophthora citrophthora]
MSDGPVTLVTVLLLATSEMHSESIRPDLSAAHLKDAIKKAEGGVDARYPSLFLGKGNKEIAVEGKEGGQEEWLTQLDILQG